MKRTGKIAVLVSLAAVYLVVAAFYVYFWFAVTAWGGAWCDNGPSCVAAEQARLLPGYHALRDVFVIGIVLLIGGTVIARRWLSRA